MADQKKPGKKVERLSLEDLEKRLAPAPVWAGGAFPGKGNGKNLDNANENAAFFKFADQDGGDDDIPTDTPTTGAPPPPTDMPTTMSPPPYGPPPGPPAGPDPGDTPTTMSPPPYGPPPG